MEGEPPDTDSDNDSYMSFESFSSSPPRNTEIPVTDGNDMTSLGAGTTAFPTDSSSLQKSPQLAETSMQSAMQEAVEDEENTIIVTGQSLGSDDDELCQYYFDNENRSGGGNISSIIWDEERKGFLVTFVDRIVAKRVASREHSLKKSVLRVHLCQLTVPPRDRDAQPQSRSEHHSTLPTDVIHKNRFAVFGVPQVTSSQCLQNYLEFAMDVCVATLSLQEYHWLVDLDLSDDEIDVLQMNRALEENHFAEDIQLTIKEIPLRRTILVKGLKPTSTDESVKLFFANKIRNNGGPVEKVDRLHNGKSALVHFENHEDAENVLKKGKHTLDGSQLHVTLYSGADREGKHEAAMPPSKEEQPQPRSAPSKGQINVQIEAEACNTIFESQELLKKLVMELKSVNAKAQLKSPDHIISIKCLQDVPTREWKRNVQDTMGKFLSSLPQLKPSEEAGHAKQTNRHLKEPLPQNKIEIAGSPADFTSHNEADLSGWSFKGQMSKVIHTPSSPMGQLTEDWKQSPPSIMLSAGGHNEYLSQHKSSPKSEICHEPSPVMNASAEDRKLSNTSMTPCAMAQTEHFGKQNSGLEYETSDSAKPASSADKTLPHPTFTKEEIFHLKPWQQKILSESAVLQYLCKDHPGVEISVDEEAKTARVRAPENEKVHVQNNFLTFLTNTSERVVSLTSAQAKMYEQGDAVKWIKKTVIDEHDLLCHLQVSDGQIILVGQRDELIRIEEYIKGVFVETTMELEESESCLLKSPTWLSFVNDLQRNDGSPEPVLMPKDNKITIVDTPSNISKTRSKLKCFLDKNKWEEKTLDINQNYLNFLKRYNEDSVKSIQKKAKENGVTITFIRYGMVAKGPKDCLPNVIQEMNNLLGRILLDRMTFSKPGIAKYLAGPKGQEFLLQVGNVTKCFVTTGGQENDHGDGLDQLGGSNIIANICLRPEHRLQIIQGDITKCQVDAIVNAANKELSHDGGVAAAIVQAGGSSIQVECDVLIKENGSLSTTEVRVTRAGRLPCSHVIHAVGPMWSDGVKDDKKLLMETIKNVLKKAQDMNLTSIALPAISCGVYDFPVNAATSIILHAIGQFFMDKGQACSLKTLVLIDVNFEPVNGFLQAAKSLFGKSVEVKNTPKATRGRHNTTQQQEAKAGSFGVSHRSHSDHEYGERSQAPLKIIPGEIAKAKADVIVCTTHPSLELEKGVLSKSILREGGAAIQQELMRYREKFGVPRVGQVVHTPGGRLHCKYVFHLSLPRWHEDHGQVMRSAVAECLKEASKKKARSIAFPTLGTGRLGYPSDQVAVIMSSAIRQWFDNQRDSSLKEVQVIVFPKDTESLQVFHAGERQSGQKTESRTSHQFRGRRDDTDSAGGFRKCKVKIGKITVMVKEGDILSEPCDAIVNSTNDNLDLSKGVLSKAISKAGGSDLTVECRKQKSQMIETGVAVTRVEGLGCGTVIHVSADRYKGDWQKGISEVLHVADKEEISSLAMPALGTGSRGADPEELAQAMQTAVAEFARRTRTLKEVRIVVFQPQLMGPYISAFDPSASSHSHRAERSDSSAEAYAGHSEKKSLLTVDVSIYSFEESAIKDARKKIHKHVTDAVVSKTETNPLISCFTSEQSEKMFRLQNKFNVELVLEKKKNAVTFTGVETDVLSAISDLKDIMMLATTARHMAAGGPPVRWQYETGSEKFADFDPETNLTIEAAFRRKESAVCITDKRGRQYRIVFKDKKEYRLNDPQAKPVAVKRRDILQEKSQEIPLPTHWAPMKGDKLKQVNLQPDSPEYKRVAAYFGQQETIKTIERIQNPTLFQQFKVKKKELEQYNPKGTENEKRLFHGTSADSVKGIITNGFNRSYCGKNGTALGAGVYFAADSRTSMGYTSGGGKMFQARVLVGEYTTGNSSMRTPPMKPSSDRPYDSVGNAASNASVFVIFHDCQAYPEYLISF